jgi:hypothetical protein
VEGLEVSAGTQRRTGTGAAIGALLGGGVGAAAIATCDDTDSGLLSCSDYTAVMVGGGAVIGLLFGAVAGYGSVKDDWQPLPVTARVGVVPAGRGRALVVALSLPVRRR